MSVYHLIRYVPYASALDLACFGPLKRYLTLELNSWFFQTASRLQRLEWTQCYATARYRAFRIATIESGFMGTGTHPLNRDKPLSKLGMPPLPPQKPPPIWDPRGSPDLSLLFSRPLRSSSTSDVTKLINQIVAQSTIATPAKRYISRTQRDLVITHSRNTLLKKDLKESRALLSQRRARKKGKRVILEGRCILNTQEILGEVE